MKKALITGITGQDGAYLAHFLLGKGYEVFGTYRRVSTPNFWRLQYLDVFDRVHLISADLVDSGSLIEAIRISEPEEIYHLAAQSFVGASFEEPIGAGEMTGLGVTRILEAIRQIDPEIRFYQASTSELFGNSGDDMPMDEDHFFRPANPYAAAKLYGYWITRIYREGYQIFTCNGILFNHESPLRGLEFVTRKISNAVAKIAHGLQKGIRLGNLDAKRDWGYAPDYVESMWTMIQQDEPGDYVIATNESHTVREFAEKAFHLVGLDYQDYITVDKRFLRPLDVRFLQGDYAKAKRELGWRPRVAFDELVRIMVEADMDRWEKWQNGEQFPWDAMNYPSEDKILSRYQRIDR
ncbi:MAG TPA: GDP-mannose 4,6-dehydratase [Methanomicrobiales archaeon]|nr:GDP-mannose 4,6-dehydratase [Methanomicrobiales archaeon]